MKFTKETTVEQIVKRFTEVGYYLPYQRIKSHVKYSIYTEAISQLRSKGVTNARDYFAIQVAALKEEEVELYLMAVNYGEV